MGWRTGYLRPEDAIAVGTTIKEARQKMRPGEMKVVELPDGQRPVTVRIMTAEELALLKK